MNGLDQSIFNLLHSLAGSSPALDFLFVFGALTLPWLVVLWAFWSILRKKEWSKKQSLWKNRFQYFSLGLISVVVSRGIVANLLQNTINNPRPFATLDIDTLIAHAPTGSFPSGHMSLLIPMVLLLFIVSRKAGWFGLLLTLFVGFSRVVAGIHWPIDILGGIIVGLLSFLFVKILFERKKLI